MQRIFTITSIILILFLIEAIMVNMLAMLGAFVGGSTISGRNSWGLVSGLILFRTVFFTVPQVILFFLFIDWIADKGWLRFSVLNVLVFIILSGIAILLLEGDLNSWLSSLKNLAFERPTLLYFVVATFFSPLIIIKLPILKNLLGRL